MNMQKKFGTFGGVFTPSLLTILGVIMYMRLGTVVGNSSNIFMFVSIILFAHMVSITTGFSVSSIATDKKIKAGGIYYILTRSLGFPIGGAIGVTLFVATALSISLYLVGFAESMLPVIQDVFGIQEITVNHFRVVGSLALLLVLVIAYVSTSFAIKIQYIILVLIGLSLISVFTGSSEGLKRGVDVISNPTFSVLFGIFFPAVTGFTAGVAMSGDLKNPSKSIPWGTMLAILTGLIVYISLAFYLNASIDKEILSTNNNALIQFGSIPMLVIAGVWGATLSSALGGILGGPRILQAMSLDNITPKIFSVGHGPNNEPRNALILTFVISELGILIGELNVIAEIVAMFYMAAYLFINISCFLEQWASPDFRPKLKIPLWVSFVGAITTFLLMVQLNLGATLVSVAVMILIFFWLTRKELVLGTGDVWLSVWSNVVKIGLKNLYKKSAHKRNWQPNILLFSGATKDRPHLIELSKSIAGRNGMVSNFDLIEEKSAEILFPKHHQNIPDDQSIDDSIFHRRIYCQNIFKGIEVIANTYGFSGIDPNTVLMGWARNTQDPLWFAQMTQKLTLLDYNILYLDYDKKRGFGSYNKIDIWWTAINSECDLTLQLSKLILHSGEWSNASIRILYVNDSEDSHELINDVINRKIQKLRIDITVEMINNEIEQKSLYKLIQLYSNEADLIMMNLPEISKGIEKQYVESTSSLMDIIGTTLIVRSSSSFKEEDLKTTNFSALYKEEINADSNISYNDLKIEKTSVFELDSLMIEVDQRMNEFTIDLSNRFYKTFNDNFLNFSSLLLNRLSDENDSADLSKLYSDLIKHVDYFKENRINKLERAMSESIAYYLAVTSTAINQIPESILVPVFENELEPKDSDSFAILKLKSSYRKKLKKGNLKPYKVPLKELALFHYENDFLNDFNALIKTFGVSGYVINQKLKDLLDNTTALSSKENSEELIADLKQEIDDTLNQQQLKFTKKLFALTNKLVNNIVADSVKLDIDTVVQNRQEEYYSGNKRAILDQIKFYPTLFKLNQGLILNQLITYIDMKGFRLSVGPFLQFKEKLFSENYFNIPLGFISEINQSFSTFKPNEYELAISKIELLTADFSIDDQLYDLRTHVENQIANFSFDNETLTADGVGSFIQLQSQLPTIKLNLANVVTNLFDNQVLEKVSELFNKSKQEVVKQLKVIENQLELNKFTLENQTDNKLIKEVLDKSALIIDTTIAKLTELQQRFDIDFNKLYQLIDEVFVDDVVIERAKNHHSSVSKSPNKGFWSKKMDDLNRSLISFINSTDNVLVQALDSLAFSKYFEKDKSVQTPVTILKEFTSKALPNHSVLNQLPFYYKQLFIGKHSPPEKPLENRKSEYAQLVNAVDNFNNGANGIVIVSGESSSGKSYLINNVLNSPDQNKLKIHIKPPMLFTANPEELINKSLSDAFGVKASNEKIFEGAANQTIIYIEDFELWWKRNSIGFSIIHAWENIFLEYNHKLLFVVECNKHFLKLLSQVFDVEKLVSSIIYMQPFSSFEIQKTIQSKNNLSGVQFSWKNHNSNSVNNRYLKRLFYKLNRTAKGNIGWASRCWIAAVENIDENMLSIKDFKYKYIPDVLDADQDMILLQVVLHKTLHLKDLIGIFSSSSSESVNESIGKLVRSNLLISDHGSLNLNPYLQSYIIAYLYDKKLLF